MAKVGDWSSGLMMVLLLRGSRNGVVIIIWLEGNPKKCHLVSGYATA